jgi:hypothetical protein
MLYQSTHTRPHTRRNTPKVGEYRPDLMEIKPIDLLTPTNHLERLDKLVRIRQCKAKVWAEYYYQLERGMNPPLLVARSFGQVAQ